MLKLISSFLIVFFFVLIVHAQEETTFWKEDNNTVLQFSVHSGLSDLTPLNQEINTLGIQPISNALFGLGFSFIFPNKRNFMEVYLSYSGFDRQTDIAGMHFNTVQGGLRWSFASIDKGSWSTFPLIGANVGTSKLEITEKKDGNISFSQALHQPRNVISLQTNMFINANIGWQINKSFSYKDNSDLMYIGARIEANYPVNNQQWQLGGTRLTATPLIYPEYLKFSLIFGYN